MKIVKPSNLEKVAGGLILSGPGYGISPFLPVKPILFPEKGTYPLPIRSAVM